MDIAVVESGLTKKEEVELAYVMFRGFTHVQVTRWGVSIVWKGKLLPSGEFVKEYSKLLSLGKYHAIQAKHNHELVEISEFISM